MAEFAHSELTICEVLLHCNIISQMSDLYRYGRQYIVMVSIVAVSNISCYCHLLQYLDMINQCSTICCRFFTICLSPFNVNMEQQCLLHVIDIFSLKSPTLHVGIFFFSFETMCNSSSVNLDIGVDGGSVYRYDM